MADILVASAVGLSAALSTAKAGDIIRLSAGNYGDVDITSKSFGTGVTITSADPGNPAVMRSLVIYKSSGVTIDNVDVSFVPDAGTLLHHAGVRIFQSADIEFVNGQIKGGPAVSGVPQTATQLDSTGNVIGLPTGRGVSVEGSENVRIAGSDLSAFHKGIVLSASSNITIEGNHIHHVRTGTISGGSLSNVKVNGNTLSDSNPWRWGDGGDHADFIHFWTDLRKQTSASTGISITNNHIEQGDGAPIIGIYLDDNGNGLGFTGANLSGNVMLNGNVQGLRLENTSSSTVRDNVFLETGDVDAKAPGIYIAAGTKGVTVTHNVLGHINDADKTNVAWTSGNTLAQNNDASLPNFYDQAILDAVSKLIGAAAVDYLLGALGDGDPVEATNITANQRIAANSGEDTPLRGGLGHDTLIGLGGHDTLNGGGGNDLLSAGGGEDLLIGGLGADRFNFTDGYIGTGVDTISDFSRLSGDRINVHSIDANTRSAGDQDFTFIGTKAFSGTPGELRYVKVSLVETKVLGDINGDGAADFTIKVVGAGTLYASDFIV